MTGYGTAAANALPDHGLLTLTEMAQNVERIASSIEVPLIADADTGYGDADNVGRTVREYIRAGASALHLEDQSWPKKCGHMDGKSLVSTEEMVAKIEAAIEARGDAELLVIARTDAIAVEGFDAAIERGRAYAEAGADMLFIEAPESREQLEAIPRLLPERPHVVNLAPRTPQISAQELEELGYRLAIYPGISLVAAMTETMEQLAHLKATGVQENLAIWKERFEEFNGIFLPQDNKES